jgi:acyl phosphate:glycerol-3-phosphate acyltransferase
MIVENFYLNTAVIALAAYLIGSFPSAFIAGKIRNVNILKTGTRNVGGMNVISSIGRIPGIIVITVDIMKGFLAASLADRFSDGYLIPLWAVIAVIAGHNWMIYIGFKGGKGVAAFLGGILYLSPWSFLVLCLIIIPITLLIIMDTYLSTVISFFIFGFFLWVREGSVWWLIFGLLVTLFCGIKCASLIKEYFTSRRRDISPIIKKLLRPFFREA